MVLVVGNCTILQLTAVHPCLRKRLCSVLMFLVVPICPRLRLYAFHFCFWPFGGFVSNVDASAFKLSTRPSTAFCSVSFRATSMSNPMSTQKKSESRKRRGLQWNPVSTRTLSSSFFNLIRNCRNKFRVVRFCEERIFYVATLFLS